MAACGCDMFKIRKLSGYIFHLHLVVEGENVERSVGTVKLLRYIKDSGGGTLWAVWRKYGLCL